MIRKLLFFLFVSVGFLYAGITSTKHNLSTSGTGTIKATSEQEICVFCHIPHGTQQGKPLWNRAMPTSTYTMYSSTYLERTNYTRPTDLGTSVDTPGNLSRQCLSCHDGTIAIGGVYALRGTVLGSNIAVANTNANGTMKNSASGFIGTDLSAHHPVGYEYGLTMDFSYINETTRGNELKTTPTLPVKLYTYSGKKYVECSSCHDPHTENKKFLRVGADNSDSHGTNIKNTCTSCHEKDGFTASIHNTKATVYTDTTALSNYGAGTTVADMGCVNCHTPHNGEGQPYLLRKIEQNTCFQGPAGSTATASCHQTAGTPGKDIETQLNKSYGHGYTLLNTDGVHTNLDYVYGAGIARDPVGSKGIEWSDSQHVECMDCHNQHQAKANTRVAAADWYPTVNNSSSNQVSTSGPLTGASGVKPTTWPGAWTKPTTFTTLETATYEYEICFKCHSSWALDNAASPVSSYNTFSTNSIDTVKHGGSNAMQFTDTAWEFNVNNNSGHPVTVAGNSRSGSLALTANRMISPWNANVGTQTMMCSDCHGSNDETTKSKGPHGSTLAFMLKGTYTNWPALDNGTIFQQGSTKATWNTGGQEVFCKNCHDVSQPKAHKENNKDEMNGIYCMRCHSLIPHGTQRRRLFVYKSDPAPYHFNSYGLVTSFTTDHEDSVSANGTACEANACDKNCNTKH